MDTKIDNSAGPDDMIPCSGCAEWFWSIGKTWDLCNWCRRDVEV